MRVDYSKHLKRLSVEFEEYDHEELGSQGLWDVDFYYNKTKWDHISYIDDRGYELCFWTDMTYSLFNKHGREIQASGAVKKAADAAQKELLKDFNSLAEDYEDEVYLAHEHFERNKETVIHRGKEKTIYRYENPTTQVGMWYNANGEFNPFIVNLTDGKAKELPMPYNPLQKKDGKDWYSGVGDLESFVHWFSVQDKKELIEAGYKLYRFVVTEWQELDTEVLFTRESIVEQVVLKG